MGFNSAFKGLIIGHPMSDVVRVSLNRKPVYGTVRGRFMSKMTYLDVLLS